ncbi:MAG: hypothetical protein ACRD44_00870 [Bryobacteraceae bacterium]
MYTFYHRLLRSGGRPRLAVFAEAKRIYESIGLTEWAERAAAKLT